MAEKTLGMIKPDAVEKNAIGKIISMIEDESIKIKAIKMTRLTKKSAEEFYSVHKEKPFFSQLVEFMTSGPVVPMILEGENVIQKYRELMGETDFTKAKKGTIRKNFGSAMEKNAVHGSDSPENAKKEISFFFSTQEELGIF
ncbi:MAG: nucleoside-diphosphate kinase [Desulforegulaceae bacterium]|nr:nucleoside-diphosphate kinase [Desulforegulaceae bacterium]